MVIALFALSLVMMVGGIAAMVQGFPYVRLESGLVMVIGGATAASAGAVLLGIGVAVGQLKRIATLLAERRAGGRAEAPLPAAEPVPAIPFRAPALEEALPVALDTRAGLVAGAAGLAGLSLGAVVADGGAGGGRRPTLEPVFAEPPLPGLLPAVEPQTPPEVDLFAAEETSAVDAAMHDAMHDDRAPGADTLQDPAPENLSPGDLLPEDPTPGAEVQESFALRPAIEDAHPEPEAEAPQAVDTRTVLGQHSADGSTYTMYSDGTIETDGLIGKRIFRSLEELSRFKSEHQNDAA